MSRGEAARRASAEPETLGARLTGGPGNAHWITRDALARTRLASGHAAPGFLRTPACHSGSFGPYDTMASTVSTTAMKVPQAVTSSPPGHMPEANPSRGGGGGGSRRASTGRFSAVRSASIRSMQPYTPRRGRGAGLVISSAIAPASPARLRAQLVRPSGITRFPANPGKPGSRSRSRTVRGHGHSPRPLARLSLHR
jgi:hypothetical protein